MASYITLGTGLTLSVFVSPSNQMFPCISHSFDSVLKNSEYLVKVLKLKMLGFYNYRRGLARRGLAFVYFLHIYGRKIRIYG